MGDGGERLLTLIGDRGNPLPPGEGRSYTVCMPKETKNKKEGLVFGRPEWPTNRPRSQKGGAAQKSQQQVREFVSKAQGTRQSRGGESESPVATLALKGQRGKGNNY